MTLPPTIQLTLDDIFTALEKDMVKVLVQNATDAAIAGDAGAQSRLTGVIRWDQVNKAALALVEQYAEDVKRGGSLCTVTREDGSIGQEFVPWLRDYSTGAKANLVILIEEHIESGEGITDLTKKLEPFFNSMKGHAETVARTEMSRIRNDAAVGRYVKAGVEKVEYLVGPEPCEICDPDAGKIFPMADAPYLPRHPRCCCGYAPSIDIPGKEEA
jgi:SPP1 gp7 family putative phage head morphogenesis protein